MISTWHNQNNLTLKASGRIGWYGLKFPAADFDRAVLFYETLLDVKLRQAPADSPQMAVSPVSSLRWGAA